MSTLRYVGLDVHKETIAVAICESGDAPVRSLGTIPNAPPAVTQLLRRLGPVAGLQCFYEAGPCGYDLYRQLHAQAVACAVVAPTLIPVRPGDRVKTDRRDAAKLARLGRSGDLTPVWVPAPATAALRELVRTRHAAQRDRTRAKHRLVKLLLRHGVRPPTGVQAWTHAWNRWVEGVRLPAPHAMVALHDYLAEVLHQRGRVDTLDRYLAMAVPDAPPPLRTVIEGLPALRGIRLLTAATLATEIGSFARFTSPRPLMAYCGLVPREHSSGGVTHRGPITKTGNARCRHVLIEAAWQSRRPLTRGGALTRRVAVVPPALRPLAHRAAHRLHARYVHLLARGKTPTQTVTAVARELLGFVWALAVALERPPAGTP